VQARGTLINAYVGRHPGQRLAHPTTAKAVVLCCRGTSREEGLRDFIKKPAKKLFRVLRGFLPGPKKDSLQLDLVSLIYYSLLNVKENH